MKPLVAFEKPPGEVQGFMKINHRFEGIFRMNKTPDLLIKKNRKMSTCNRVGFGNMTLSQLNNVFKMTLRDTMFGV